MRGFLIRFRAAILLAALCLQAAEIDSRLYMDHICYLASDELAGRGTGTDGLDAAAEYIAAQFRSFGLQPLSEGSYLQRFPVTVDAKLKMKSELSYRFRGRTHNLQLYDSFLPLNFSSAGRISGELVFAGYGITAPEYGYDDYAGIEARGKIAVILRHEPQEFQDSSVFQGKIYTGHSQYFSKAMNAVRNGARGLLIVSDSFNHVGQTERFEAFAESVGPGNASIPVMQIKSNVVEKWFAEAGRDFHEVQREIDADLQPRSFAFPLALRATIRADVQGRQRLVSNVAGYIPGVTSEYVVIGAHYDHLGLGEQYSMASGAAGTIHPGADDNASGTAGVIELARWFSRLPKQKRGILFLAFAGEEIGLLGSSHYVNNPMLPLDDAIAMLNMDMIGRVREGKVYIGGAGTGSAFPELLEIPIAQSGLVVDYSDKTGYGSSDHTSFISKQIPVLFFFSGLHGDYHRPSDTWDRIEAAAAARLVGLAGKITQDLIDHPERPRFTASPPASPE